MMTIDQHRKFRSGAFPIQSTLGFATTGLAANLGIATATPLTDPRHYIKATLGITTPNYPKFRPLCSEIATVYTFGGRYTQQRIVSENPLNLATSTPCDGG